MTTICKKCTHYKRFTIIAGERMHRCYAKWGAQTIHRVTGDLTPESWSCDEKNPADEPCPKYKPRGRIKFMDVAFAVLILFVFILSILGVFFPGALP
jgi:hypothetical protein